MQERFRQNLVFLCGYYSSVSEVCRRIGINRGQFNKYVNGSVFPGRHNMRRICDFFGVEEHELLMPTDQFRELVRFRPRISIETDSQEGELIRSIRDLQSISNNFEMSHYSGFYFEYYHSMSFPGNVLRTLVHVVHREGATYYDRIERLEPVSSSHRGARCHYRGHAVFLKDRIFLVDYEALTSNEVSQTVLFPNYKSSIDRLDGIKLGVAAGGQRIPAAARVTWEYLGRNVTPWRCLRKVGLLEISDPALDDGIRARIDNTQDDPHLFLAKSESY